jgi:hypothetical protein
VLERATRTTLSAGKPAGSVKAYLIIHLATVASLLAVAATSRADTAVVTTMAADAWFGLNEGPATSLGQTVFTPGPNTPPSGVGSATLQVDGEGRASFGTLLYRGTPLAAITELRFSANPSSGLTPANLSLQFDVDYDGSDADTSFQGRLVFEPAGAPVTDVWTEHDTLAGTWWATRAPGQTFCPQSNPCTWAAVLAAFPNAEIRDDPFQRGALLFRLGGPIPGGAIVSLDAFTIAKGLPSTTYDFEPGAAVIPSIGPADSVVAVHAYGFRALRNVRVFFYTNRTSKSRIKICRGRSALDGSFSCAVQLPAAVDAGPPGVHAVRVRGPRRIDYLTDFLLTP